jgi:hypothetical protein
VSLDHLELQDSYALNSEDERYRWWRARRLLGGTWRRGRACGGWSGAQTSDLLLPGYDFWLIDGRVLFDLFFRISDFDSFAPVPVGRWCRR